MFCHSANVRELDQSARANLQTDRHLVEILSVIVQRIKSESKSGQRNLEPASWFSINDGKLNQ